MTGAAKPKVLIFSETAALRTAERQLSSLPL
jgi:hypothetical protein